MSNDYLYQTSLLLFVRTNYVSLMIESLAFGAYMCISAALVNTVARRRRMKNTRLVLAHFIGLIMVTVPWYCLRVYVGGRRLEGAAFHPEGEDFTAIELVVSSGVYLSYYIFDTLLIWCVDLLLLWRAYMLWKGNLIIIPILIAAYMAVFATGLAQFLTLFEFVPINSVTPIITSNMVASVTFNVLTTSTIAMKMLRQRKRLIDAGVSRSQASQTYISLSSIFIESAAIYTLSGIVATYFLATSSDFSQPFTTLFESISFVNPALIQLRLVQREANELTTTKNMSSFPSLPSTLVPPNRSLEDQTQSSWST